MRISDNCEKISILEIYKRNFFSNIRDLKESGTFRLPCISKYIYIYIYLLVNEYRVGENSGQAFFDTCL